MIAIIAPQFSEIIVGFTILVMFVVHVSKIIMRLTVHVMAMLVMAWSDIVVALAFLAVVVASGVGWRFAVPATNGAANTVGIFDSIGAVGIIR